MALTGDQKSSRLFKKSLGVAETITTKEFFSEAKLGRTGILPSQIWAEADLIPNTAPVLSDGQSSGVTEYHYQVSLSFIPGSISGGRDVAYSGATLKDAIPFNYGDGSSYGYKLYTSTGTVIADGVGDWLVDGEAGVLTFYTPGSIPAGVASATPPKISFYKYIGVKGLIASGVTTDVTSLSMALSTEVSDRTSGDSSLTTKLSTEISDRTSGDSSLTTKLSTEISDRTSADTSITTKLSTEISDRTSADLSLSTSISGEVSLRTVESNTYLKISGGTMVGVIDMGAYQIIMSGSPLGDNYLTNKAYVDAIAQGVAIHAPVHVVATGVTILSGVTTIDGHSVIEGDFALVAGQSNAAENGIYVVHSGATGWTRRPDADGNPTNEIELGDFVFVQSGATQASTGWAIGNTDAPTGQTYIIPGVDTENWFKMAAPGTYTTDGQALKLNGTVFSILLSGSTLVQDVYGLKLSDGLSTAISNNTTNISTVSQDLSTEIGDRGSADVSLSTAIINAVTGYTSADTSLSTSIASLSGSTSGLTSAVSSLSTAVSYNTYVINVLSGVTDSLSTAISVTNSTLSASVSTLTSVDNSLSTAISGTTSSVVSLSTSVSNQISSLISTDIVLSTIISSTVTGITSLSTAVSTLISNDSSMSTALSGITSNVLSMSTAISTLTSVDSSLSTAITGLTGNIGSLSTAISNEVSTRTSADQSLTSAISNVVTGYTSADASLSTLLVASNSGITSLSIALSVVISGNTYDDSSLSTAIFNEISTRTSADQSLSSVISNVITGYTSADTSFSTALSVELSTRASADQSIMTVINNLSGVTAQTAGSGLTYNSTEKALNVNVDGWTIKIIGDQLVGSRQWIQVTTTANVTGPTSGYTGLALTYNPITPVTAYVNGIEYLIYPGTNPALNYPFFYNQYPPVLGTQIWFDPIFAEFDLISGTDMVTIKYLIVEV